MILKRVNDGVKGELVLVVDGAVEAVNETWKFEALAMLKDGKTMKDIVSEISERHGLSRNEVKRVIISNSAFPNNF